MGKPKKGTSSPGQILRISLIAGGILGILGVLIQGITEPMIVQELTAYGIDGNMLLQNDTLAPWWAMTLLGFSAGVIEEVVFRFGLLTLLAVLGSLIWKPRNGQLNSGLFWIVNALIALIFSLAHFSNLIAAGIPLVPGFVLRILVGNSLATLVFGWLYWKRGLESAILTHTFLDIFVYVVYPSMIGLLA